MRSGIGRQAEPILSSQIARVNFKFRSTIGKAKTFRSMEDKERYGKMHFTVRIKGLPWVCPVMRPKALKAAILRARMKCRKPFH
jgi:hypothetical protein